MSSFVRYRYIASPRLSEIQQTTVVKYSEPVINLFLVITWTLKDLTEQGNKLFHLLIKVLCTKKYDDQKEWKATIYDNYLSCVQSNNGCTMCVENLSSDILFLSVVKVEFPLRLSLLLVVKSNIGILRVSDASRYLKKPTIPCVTL